MAHGDQEGMTKREFEEFSEQLPDAYKERFARLGTFEKLANDKGRLEFADFELVMDVFAQMVVDDVDIELEIVKEEHLPDAELTSGVSTQSAMSVESDESEEDEEEEKEDKKGGIGFLEKLKSWRGHRKDASAVSRQLRIKTPTPVADGGNASFGNLDMFSLVTGGKQKKKKPADVDGDTEEKQKMGNTLSPRDALIPSKPKPVKSMSTLESLDEDALDEEEIDDEDINAYMAKTMEQNPDDDDSPVNDAGDGGGGRDEMP